VKIIDNDSERTAVIGSVGKTRAYLFRNETLERITRDHGIGLLEKYTDKHGREIILEETVIEAMDAVRTGIDLREFRQKKFGPYPGRDIWRHREHVRFSVGSSLPQNLTIYEVPLEAKDTMLVVSEGIQNLSRGELTHSLRAHYRNPAEPIVSMAIGIATTKQHARSFPADFTAVAVQVNER
jgi:serine/threonine protein phosphatase PrpC